MLRRYLVFTGNEAPAGGWDDYIGSADEFAVALEILYRHERATGGGYWGQIVDTINDVVTVLHYDGVNWFE